MKILKYIMFLSILSGLFLVIYRQSDKKGFRRWYISFRMAAFIAAILAGLIPPSTEAIEPDVFNNSPSIERVLSNQECNSLEKNDRQVILVKHGDSDQNKAGIEELPDSSKFIYGLDSKVAKKALKKVWKNPKAKKEVLAGLTIMDRGELLPRNKKDFKGFKTIKEIKLKGLYSKEKTLLLTQS